MNTINPSPSANAAPSHMGALEGQLALRITARLSSGTESLPYDITERLRFGRERALALASQQRRAAALVVAQPLAMSGRAAVLGGPPSVWLRLASALPLVVLVAGLVLIQQHHDSEQISAAAEIDSALLADELPPAAYGDPGFSEFLHNVEAP